MSRSPRFKRILVVDDEEDTRALVGWVFRDLGFDVDLAGEGMAALEKIELIPPDLVILDLVMPGGDGWMVLEHLRFTPGAPPAVVMTACGDSDSFSKAVRFGVAGYVFKPFRVGDLVTTCEKILASRDKSVPRASERRREPRRTLTVELRAHADDRAAVAWGKLIDLSPSGAQLDLAAPLEPGERVHFDFQIPDGETPLLTLQGRVQWRGRAAEPGFAHGLVFENLHPEAQRQLRELLCPA